MGIETAVDRKMMLRLLKLLSTVPGRACTYNEKDDHAIILTGSKKVKFPVSQICKCERDGLVSSHAGKLTLTPDGLAHLKWALYPDAPFHAQNMQMAGKTIIHDKVKTAVLVNQSESPLLRLFTRKEKSGKTWLDEKQFMAGERLRSDFEKANLQPRVSANWEASVSSGNRGGGLNDLSDFALDARRRVERAIAEMGPELSEVVLDICCYLKGLEMIERERGWPPRSAKLLLRTALSALARHYGLDTPDPARSSAPAIRSWSTADYRPTLSPQ